MLGHVRQAWIRRNVMKGHLASKHTEEMSNQVWFVLVDVLSLTFAGKPTTFMSFKETLTSQFLPHLVPPPSNTSTSLVFPTPSPAQHVLLWCQNVTVTQLRTQLQRDTPFVLGDHFNVTLEGSTPFVAQLSVVSLAQIVKEKAALVNVDGMATKIAALKSHNVDTQTNKTGNDNNDDDDDEWKV